MALAVAGLLIVLDQLSKFWVVHNLPLGGPREPLALGFHLTYVRNTGAAFGILQDVTLLLSVLSAVVSAAILYALLRHGRRMPPLQRWAFALIFAGAVGNLIDRIRLGYVIDFIDFYVPGVIDFAIFNVADASVVVGAGLLLLAALTDKGEKARPDDQREAEEGLETRGLGSPPNR
ncbi:signal peptidase II [soil metagenome]